MTKPDIATDDLSPIEKQPLRLVPPADDRDTEMDAAVSSRRRSSLISRNLIISGKRTSARLEPDMWAALFDIVRREHRSVHSICSLIDQHKPQDCSLTAAIRVFIMAYFRSAATEEGHARAGHGYGQMRMSSILGNKPVVPVRMGSPYPIKD